MDDYLDGLPPEQRDALARVRAAKAHLSVFPFSPAAVDAVKDRLEGFDLSKGTIRFSPSRPVPDEVLADLVRARKREIAAPAGDG